MESCSTSLVIREKEIKITGYHFTTTRVAIIKMEAMTSIGKDAGQLETSYIADEKTKWLSHFGEQFGSSSKC